MELYIFDLLLFILITNNALSVFWLFQASEEFFEIKLSHSHSTKMDQPNYQFENGDNQFIIQLKRFIGTQLNYMDDSLTVGITKPQSRDYKCPCGKTYLSYAALFTHVKQKHEGKAPGQIQKPKLESKPRGRPPLAAKTKNLNPDKEIQNSRQSLHTLKTVEENDANRLYYNGFAQIFIHLKQLLYPQQINVSIWDQVDSFKKFEAYVDGSHLKKAFEYKGVNIGYGLSQFLKDVSISTQPWRFEQVLILFMIFLQYAIDEDNNERIIQEAPIQMLIEHMNPFIEYYIQDYAEYLGAQNLWVMNKNNIRNVFKCFCDWLKWKDYTDYCINVID